MRFKDKCVLVTGAASGIGAAVAQDCALEGAHVIAFDIQPCRDVGEYHAVDVTDEEAVNSMRW
jgi:NAD(P)-dependent dehydrogenase (short-subunit alcohol dehydrogenase family)